jgi:hypothetical protein
MKAGDRVKLIGIPADAKDDADDAELQTRTLFEKCLGKSFLVRDMENVDGLRYQLARLDVGHVLGESPHIGIQSGSKKNILGSKIQIDPPRLRPVCFPSLLS